MDKLKILATADLHNNFSFLSKFKRKIEIFEPDYIFIAGDLCDFYNCSYYFLKKFFNIIKNINTFLIPGNHDSIEFFEPFENKFENFKILHKDYIKLNNILVVGIGGGDVSSMFKVTEKEILDFYKKIKDKLKKRSFILVSHLHPYNSPSSLLYKGSYALYKIIIEKEPILCIHGHIHESPSVDRLKNTILVNTAGKILECEISKSTFYKIYNLRLD